MEKIAAEKQSVIHNTFSIQRSYAVSPERVFAAFSDPAKKRRWYAESESHEIVDFQMDFRTGGNERLHYRFPHGHPIAGSEITNETRYQDIVPEKRIVFTTMMSLNGKTIQVMLGTVEFLSSGSGTELLFTNHGAFMDWPDGPAMIEAGWRGLFNRLANELTR